MARRAQTVVFAVMLAIGLSVVWQGCGSDHHGASADFVGNVSGVSPSQAKLESRSQKTFAALDWFFASRAVAQSTCPAKHVLLCLSNGRDPVRCSRVNSDTCSFDLSIDTLDNNFAEGHVAFFDDANDNGNPDSGEGFAFLSNPIGSVCNGSVVTLSDVTIDFSTITATAASVVIDPNTCATTATPTPRPAGSTTPTPTRTPAPTGTPHTPTPTVTGTPPTATPTVTGTPHTPTPTVTGTPPTATPTGTTTAVATGTQTPSGSATPTGTPYGYGMSLNEPPSSMLAFLFSIGVAGLMIPRRRYPATGEGDRQRSV